MGDVTCSLLTQEIKISLLLYKLNERGFTRKSVDKLADQSSQIMSHNGKFVNSSFLFRRKQPTILILILSVIILHLWMCVYTYICITNTYIATGCISAFLGITQSSPPYSAMQAFVFPSLCEFSLWFSLDLKTETYVFPP